MVILTELTFLATQRAWSSKTSSLLCHALLDLSGKGGGSVCKEHHLEEILLPAAFGLSYSYLDLRSVCVVH